LKICLYGSFVYKRAEIEELVTLNGGEIALTLDQCDICIANKIEDAMAYFSIQKEDTSKKLNCFLRNEKSQILKKTECVTLDWLFDCIKSHYIRPFENTRSRIVLEDSPVKTTQSAGNSVSTSVLFDTFSFSSQSNLE
jgi:hypothetical protein